MSIISHQNVLVEKLKLIFPNEVPILNSRRQSQLKYAEEKPNNLELDVWFPNLNICFEFQDGYHYVTTWYNHRTMQTVRQTDNKKRAVISQNHLSLVVISCWWDGNLPSLVKTITFNCPELAEQISLNIEVTFPISLNPPSNFFPIHEIPHVGELTYPSFLIDPHIIDEYKWWIGEKYDGVRCCWSTVDKKAYSRHGRGIWLLSKLLEHLPSVTFDGELWFGRHTFELTYPLVHGQMNLVNWQSLRLIGFETAASDMQDKTFEMRYAQVLQNTSEESPFVIVASRLGLEHQVQLKNIAQIVVENEGEGLILQKFEAPYDHGRSASIFKFKMMLKDREGIVEGRDRNAVYLKLPNGTSFAVPIENVYLSNLSIGDIVTFSCTNYTNRHTPINPVIHRWRLDVTWRDVMRLYLQEQTFPTASTPIFSTNSGFSMNELRLFLENFARKKLLDPMQAETWYKIKDSDIYPFKSGQKIIKLFGSYSTAIIKLFPEILFDAVRLNKASSKDENRKRQIFEKYAKQNGFDPLVAKHWYRQRKKRLMADPDVYKVISKYSNNLTTALMDTFPDIGLERAKLKSKRITAKSSFAAQETKSNSLQKYSNTSSRRKFFEKFAFNHNFDPLVPDNWYRSSRQSILSTKGVRKVLRYHSRSVSKAIIDLFPELHLHSSKFWKSEMYDVTKRRGFFESYAKEQQFDPFVLTNWQSIPISHLHNKGIHGVLKYHNNSLKTALTELFPEMHS